MIYWLAYFLVLFADTPAHAYLDPSSGGMLLQILLGGAAGALAVLKIYWQSVKDFFGRLTGRKKEP